MMREEWKWKCQLPTVKKEKVERRWNDKLVNLVYRPKGPASTKYFMASDGTCTEGYSEESTGGDEN